MTFVPPHLAPRVRRSATGQTPEISVVLPSYRGAELARRSVETLRAFLSASGRTWEVVVVDDGGGDFGDGPWHADPRVSL